MATSSRQANSLMPASLPGRLALAAIVALVLGLTVWAYLQPDMVLAWESLMALCAGWR